MLKTVIYKEFSDNILNMRFSIGLILCLIITISCVIILSNDFQEEMKDYNLRVSLQDDFINNYAHTNRLGGMTVPQKPPELFRPLVVGLPRDTDVGSFDDNPLSVLFPPLDLLFIVTIIMSLMAILFSYDAVAGERESGTLKLMISNSLPRPKLILGKWLGGTASLLLPFIISMAAAALYISLHPRIHWGAATWIEFLILLIASIVLISLFYLLGLAVSTFSRAASTSILSSLFIWVLFILVFPNLSPYISAQLYRIPSVNRIEKEASRVIGIDRDNLGRSLVAELNGRYEAEFGEMFLAYLEMGQEARRQRAAADTEFSEMVARYRRENGEMWDEANRIQGEKADKLYDELFSRAAVQTRIARLLASFSPYANYLYFATDLTGTGLRSITYFQNSTDEFYRASQPYLERKVREAAQKNPTFNSNSFIDLSDRPRFEFREESTVDKLNAVLPNFGVLLLFTALFFGMAFIGFLKYDVR